MPTCSMNFTPAFVESASARDRVRCKIDRSSAAADRTAARRRIEENAGSAARRMTPAMATTDKTSRNENPLSLCFDTARLLICLEGAARVLHRDAGGPGGGRRLLRRRGGGLTLAALARLARALHL